MFIRIKDTFIFFTIKKQTNKQTNKQTKKKYNFPEVPKVFVERLKFWTMNETNIL